MGIEFELKFAAQPPQQLQIRKQLGDFFPISMETTYYDTASGDLAAQHITLRLRRENENTVCTVKFPAGRDARREWEASCDSIQQAIPVLCKLGAPDMLLSLPSSGLQAVCGARFTRLAKIIALPDCTVELALDCGVLTGGGRELPLCEVEVELKAGSRDAAAVYAKALAAEYGLTPENTSKFRRAWDLAKGEYHGL